MVGKLGWPVAGFCVFGFGVYCMCVCVCVCGIAARYVQTSGCDAVGYMLWLVSK